MKFTRDHEWVEVTGDTALVGITAYAANALGDVVFVEVPAPGTALKKGDSFAVVESVKAASDVYAPVSGDVIDANTDLSSSPDTVNASPEGAGWIAKIKLTNPAELDALMDRDAYETYLGTL
ncbi:glycine cleavage system protein GcvH [Asticcacaulis sp. AC402]|uniref:glycine cleavage system protein GcvH n=1 Tax=Asticcacaulis sp. AC402 TaxID=1282361 RepID=UPI0003C3B75F|nr:glycine cleavage system protein GcvH [Asticcacaulis sp. AC402]ESQ76788.1 glycine cleavage system protein H [Asticcacaulis sp. AC402]